MDKPPVAPVVLPNPPAVFTDSTGGPLTVHYTRRTLKMHTVYAKPAPVGTYAYESVPVITRKRKAKKR